MGSSDLLSGDGSSLGLLSCSLPRAMTPTWKERRRSQSKARRDTGRCGCHSGRDRNGSTGQHLSEAHCPPCPQRPTSLPPPETHCTPTLSVLHAEIPVLGNPMPTITDNPGPKGMRPRTNINGHKGTNRETRSRISNLQRLK